MCSSTLCAKIKEIVKFETVDPTHLRWYEGQTSHLLLHKLLFLTVNGCWYICWVTRPTWVSCPQLVLVMPDNIGVVCTATEQYSCTVVYTVNIGACGTNFNAA